jgi:uncharacterized repeat protein (TIGR01451 family)
MAFRIWLSRRWFAAVIIFVLAAGTFGLAAESARAAGIDWSEYPDNPVYEPSAGRAYYPCVIYDAKQFSGHGEAYFYKMWYGDTDASRWEWVVYSDDGINWENPQAVQGIADKGYHAQVLYLPDGYSAAGGNYHYKMWYWDSTKLYEIAAMRTADSTDGVNWVNDQAITEDALYPLVSGVSGTDWKRGTYGPICVFHNPSATNTGSDPFDYAFAMYYDATTGGQEVTGLAYSSDGNGWTRYHQAPYEDAPVLDHGGAGDWDSGYSAYGTIIRESSHVWHFWYSGGQTQVGDGIGYASSTDGINWDKDADNPLLHKNDGLGWRNSRAYTPSVIYSPTRFDGRGDASLYKMWFTGRSSSGMYAIGYMSSDDPVPELSLEKTAVPAGEVKRGSVITYTLRMRNSGNVPATGATLKDPVPRYTSYVTHTTTLNGERVPDAGGTTPLVSGMEVNSPGEAPGVIAPGKEVVVTFMVQVGSDLPLGAAVRNIASGEADGLAAIEAGYVNGSSAQLPSTWYFAEGSTQPGFDEYILLSNMGDGDITVTTTFITEGGDQRTFEHMLPANSRRTIYVNALMPGETGIATIVEGEDGFICERSMYFLHNGIGGGDNVIGANAPSIDLFFAEGFTGTPGSPFEEWILLLNPNLEGSMFTIDYLFPGGETLRRDYFVPGRRRVSLYVDGEVGEGREVSARIRSELPLIAERSMYFTYNGIWQGGHTGMAATGARNDWYLAEGYTGWEGSLFDEWILIANDNDIPAAVTVTYMFPDGSTRDSAHTAAAKSRLTVSADAEVGEGQMISAHIHADVPVVVERAMYFSYRDAWDGGHNCLAAPAPSSQFYFAEGYTGNPGSQFETWVLIQNTSNDTKTAVIDYFLASGEVMRQELDLLPRSRSSVFTNQVLGRESLEFSIRVTSRDGSPTLLAERAMYFSYMGSFGSSRGGHCVVGY